MRCCTIKLKRAWEYCPGCGEGISWPPTRVQLAEQAARDAEHERKLLEDPVYKRDWEAMRKMEREFYEMEIREFVEEGNIMAGLLGVKDV